MLVHAADRNIDITIFIHSIHGFGNQILSSMHIKYALSYRDKNELVHYFNEKVIVDNKSTYIQKDKVYRMILPSIEKSGSDE